MSRWLIPQEYSASIFSSIPSEFRLYFPIIFDSKLPFRSRGTLMSISPDWVFTVFFVYPFRRCGLQSQ